VINYDEEKGGYNCKANGEDVFIPEDWLTDFDER
jgi:hypothetical protein